jgi:alkaline phosphatase
VRKTLPFRLGAALASILATLLLSGCGGSSPAVAPASWAHRVADVALPIQPAVARPNVILLIGDGMGQNQLALARYAAGGTEGRLGIDRLPVTGFSLTHSTSGAVTDSAAAGTALACGVKTKNGTVGLAPTGADHVTLLEGLRRQLGYRTGLVVTKNVTDATPAAFVAEVASRKSEQQIAEQLLAEKVDVVLGGGRGWFVPKAAGGRRTDDRDLLAEARGAGAGVATDLAGLASLQRTPALGLFAEGNLDSQSATEPALAAMTQKALDLLAAGGAPFFLMVEGSQIDLAGHKNDAGYLLRETLAFDLAVQAACAFAAARQDTLVVVTADHETGGLVFTGDAVFWSTKGHTASPVPVFAGGAGAAVFGGVLDNTEIPRRIAAQAGLTPFPAVEAAR